MTTTAIKITQRAPISVTLATGTSNFHPEAMTAVSAMPPPARVREHQRTWFGG